MRATQGKGLTYFREGCFHGVDHWISPTSHIFIDSTPHPQKGGRYLLWKRQQEKGVSLNPIGRRRVGGLKRNSCLAELGVVE